MDATKAFEQALKEIFESLPHFLSHHVCEERKIHSPSPIPPNEEKLAAELEKNLFSFRKRCHNGFVFILDQLKKETSPSAHVPMLEKKLFQAFRSLLTPERFTQVLLKVVSGISWREALGISLEETKWLYQGAKNIFNNGLFAEASEAFSFLSWFDAGQQDFWMALGHSCFHIGSYQKAISAYGIASTIMPQDPWPHIHAALCYEGINDPDQAKECLRESLIIEKNQDPVNKKLIESLECRIRDLEKGNTLPLT